MGVYVDYCPGKPPKQYPVGDEHKRDVIPGKPNVHFANCGIPPTLTPGLPTGYFENVYGEQWVMQFDLDAGICRVWGGDCGWDNEMRVDEINGHLILRYLLPEEGGEDREDRHKKVSEKDRQFFESYREAVESRLGKMSEEEWRRYGYSTILNPSEGPKIYEFYTANVKASERRQRKIEREKAKAERQAEHARYKAVSRARAAERQKLADEERALTESLRALKKEQREEVELLRSKIRETKRLIRGDQPEGASDDEAER